MDSDTALSASSFSALYRVSGIGFPGTGTRLQQFGRVLAAGNQPDFRTYFVSDVVDQLDLSEFP